MFMLVGAQLSARGDESLGVDEPLLGHSLPGSSVALENGFPMDFNWLLSFCLTHTHTDRVKHDRWHTEHARRTGEEVAVSASDTNMTEITATRAPIGDTDTRRAARQTLPNSRRRHTHTGTCTYVTRPCRYIVRSREHRRANLSCDTPPLRRDLRARSRDEATGLGQYSLSLTHSTPRAGPCMAHDPPGVV